MCYVQYENIIIVSCHALSSYIYIYYLYIILNEKKICTLYCLCLPSLGGGGNSVTGGAGLVFLATVNGTAAATQQRIE